MNSLFYGVRSGSRRFVFLAIVSIGIMTLDHRQNHMEQLRSLLANATYPIQVVVDLPFRIWNSASSYLAGYTQLLEENRNLNQELFTLRQHQLKFDTLVAENARLSKLLDSVSEATVPGRYLIARILKVRVNPNLHLIQLAKGQKEGIYHGQPLLDAFGIVGQVIHVASASSQALLITDQNHSLPIRINRTGVRSIAVGSGDQQNLTLPYLATNVDLMVGDLLVTSGLDGTFPAGYPVATITKINLNNNLDFAEVEAKPLAQLDRMHEVLLVWPTPPQPSQDIDTDEHSPTDDAQ